MVLHCLWRKVSSLPFKSIVVYIFTNPSRMLRNGYMMKPIFFFKQVLVMQFLFSVTVNTGHAQLQHNSACTLQSGIWRGVLKLNDSTELPFNFEIKNTPNELFIDIINADEHIKITEFSFKDDSVFIQMPVFNSEFRLKNNCSSMTGVWINRSRKEATSIPFTAVYNESKRFLLPEKTHPLFKERWKVIFEPGTPDEYFSVGMFQTINNKISGTFTTETGDYRYLQGFSDDKKFVVSCFDGAHAYLFYADRKNGALVNGHFYSGKSGHENWKAIPDETFELHDPYSLTYLKPGYSKIDFRFKNLEGKTVSLSDDKFKNKVVIVQLMGSWCPNCMDETKFLSGFYDAYKNKGVEIIGLAFERVTDLDKAISNVNRLKARFNAQYEFLITEKTGKDQASAALPMLNAVMAFPTTIYIDKKGSVRKIYTGFSGPATGEKYTTYVQETTAFIEQLLKE
jgi:thiol-disulfide isomerase/thioredoxin